MFYFMIVRHSFVNYAIFRELYDRMRFEVEIASSRNIRRPAFGMQSSSITCMFVIYFFERVEVLAAIQLMWTCYTHPSIYTQRTATTQGTLSLTLLEQCVGYLTCHRELMNMEVTCETGPPAYRPYPRRLESVTICGCNYKGSTFSSVI